MKHLVHNLNIIYEDDDVLVVNKPAGTLVHATKTSKEKTVSDIVLERYPEMRGVGEAEEEYLPDKDARSGIVHRLDKETSGVLILAKNQKAHEFLKKQFKKRKTEKKYIALVEGAIRQKKGVIRTLVGKDKENPTRQRAMKEGDKGIILNPKEAVTRYAVRERYKEFTLLEVAPETGRTHQIRIHMEYLHHPIVGDKKYGSRAVLEGGRIFLHASSLALKLPSGKSIECKADMPKMLEDFLRTLEGEKN